jgi:hypothetical protein
MKSVMFGWTFSVEGGLREQYHFNMSNIMFNADMTALWAGRLLKWMVTDFYPPGAWHSGMSLEEHGMQAKSVS